MLRSVYSQGNIARYFLNNVLGRLNMRLDETNILLLSGFKTRSLGRLVIRPNDLRKWIFFLRIHGRLIISFTVLDLILWVRKKCKNYVIRYALSKIIFVTLHKSAIIANISWSLDLRR